MARLRLRAKGVGSAVGIAVGIAVVAGLLLGGCSSSERSGQIEPSPVAPDLVFQEHTPASTPATSFGAGSYVVGQAVQPGRYSAGEGTAEQCRWRQSDSDGGALDASGAGRPTQVLTLITEGSRLVVAGEQCRFGRLPD